MRLRGDRQSTAEAVALCELARERARERGMWLSSEVWAGLAASLRRRLVVLESCSGPLRLILQLSGQPTRAKRAAERFLREDET